MELDVKLNNNEKKINVLNREEDQLFVSNWSGGFWCVNDLCIDVSIAYTHHEKYMNIELNIHTA